MPWSSKYIDPTIPIDRNTRKGVGQMAWKQWNRNPINGLTFGLGLTIPIFMFPLISGQLIPVQSWTGFPAFLLTFVLYVSYLFALVTCMRRWRYAPCVYAELRGHGYEVCTRCGYWLRDLDAGVTRCPECGREREPMP